MFRDYVRIKLKSGNGGNGKIAFGINKMPSGGTGGNGGNVYLEGSHNMYDFAGVQPDATYDAEHGEHGGIKNLTGHNGKDLIFRVPLLTNLYNEDGKLITTISKNGQRELILEGGVGGLGNHYYRAAGLIALERFQVGKPGIKKVFKLELELQGDIIFIGLPNAGKTSILNSLTNADGKVAAYEFTTLNPHLGRMGEVTLMDLPGLIENTAVGKGLGTSFVKHTKSAKLVAHFVSLESKDPVADYELVRKEMIAIDPLLADKPELIVLTKTDLIPSAEIPAKIKLFKKYKRDTITVSAFDLDAITHIGKFFVDSLQALAK